MAKKLSPLKCKVIDHCGKCHRYRLKREALGTKYEEKFTEAEIAEQIAHEKDVEESFHKYKADMHTKDVICVCHAQATMR